MSCFNKFIYNILSSLSPGNAQSHSYNENVFRNNLKHAILGQLRAPPEGFKQVVMSHFFYKRDSLIKELEKQAESFTSRDIQKLVTEVRHELEKLVKPESS